MSVKEQVARVSPLADQIRQRRSRGLHDEVNLSRLVPLLKCFVVNPKFERRRAKKSSKRIKQGELCSTERYRPLESDKLEAEVYRLGFCRFIRCVLQSLRSRRISENVLTDQSE